MFTFDASSYGPLAAALLDPPRLNELGPGRPNLPVRSQLDALTPEALLQPRAVADRDMASACCAALWLYHDFFDESHRLSQEIETPTGSYWHGILHRREPDADNAKYWFRRVGQHPVFAPLQEAAAELCREAQPGRAAEFLVTQAAWEPFCWIDLCEAVRSGRAAGDDLCRRIQLAEWQLLFDYSFRHATP